MLRLPLRLLPLAQFALGACGAAPPEAPLLRPPQPPTVVGPVAALPPVSSPSPSTPAPVREPEPQPEAAPSPPSAEPPRVLIERPYSIQGHPRLGTEMATLERDEELFQWALGGSSDPAHPANRSGYHPATRVVVDVRLLSRAPLGSTKRIERVARSNGYWPLRACFEQAQRSSPKPERGARVRLTLSASGRVLGSRLLDAPPDREYARCVLERVRKLDFSPGFTRKLDVEISVKQWPGHAPVPPRAPDDAPRFRASNELLAACEGLSPALTACYQAGLARDPKLWGRLALSLNLDAVGVVQNATEVETHFPDPNLVECARQAVSGARLVAGEVAQLTLAIRFGQGVTTPPAPASPGTPPAPAPAPPESGPGPSPALPWPPTPPAPESVH